MEKPLIERAAEAVRNVELELAGLTWLALSPDACRRIATAVMLAIGSEWRPMSEAPRIVGDHIIICQPGSTDHYAVCEWGQGCEGDDDAEVLAWRDQLTGDIAWTDEDMAKAFSPAMWKPLGPPPPSSLCHEGAKPQWVVDWQAAYDRRQPHVGRSQF